MGIIIIIYLRLRYLVFFFFFVLKKTSEDTYIALVDHTVYIKIMWDEHTPVVRV